MGKILHKGGGEKTIKQVGEEIGRIHEGGFALGDAKPDNIICAKDGLFFTDLEQAKIGGDKAWDLAEFLNYTLAFTFNKENARSMTRSFASGYLKFGDRRSLEKIKEPKYSLIFKPIVAPNISKTIDSEIDEVIREFKP